MPDFTCVANNPLCDPEHRCEECLAYLDAEAERLGLPTYE